MIRLDPVMIAFFGVLIAFASLIVKSIFDARADRKRQLDTLTATIERAKNEAKSEAKVEVMLTDISGDVKDIKWDVSTVKKDVGRLDKEVAKTQIEVKNIGDRVDRLENDKEES